MAGRCGVSLDPGSVGAVDEGYVVEDDVVDVFCDSSIFSDAADTHPSGFAADDIAHMDVAAVGFD